MGKGPPATSSKIGAMLRQALHQEAVAITTVGLGEFRTCASKESCVTFWTPRTEVTDRAAAYHRLARCPTCLAGTKV